MPPRLPGTPRFTEKEWNKFLEIGAQERYQTASFDWDVPAGYISFGTFGMTVHKLRGHTWYEKYLSGWRGLTVKEANEQLKEQEWLVQT